MDGTEDEMLWEDEDDSSEGEETKMSQIDEDKEKADPFDDRITMEQFHELFDQSDDSDEEFEGF